MNLCLVLFFDCRFAKNYSIFELELQLIVKINEKQEPNKFNYDFRFIILD